MTIVNVGLIEPATRSFPKVMKSKRTGAISLVYSEQQTVTLVVGKYSKKFLDQYTPPTVGTVCPIVNLDEWEDYDEPITIQNVHI